MKSWVVYESMWGNTEQVARAIARGLQQWCDVTVLEVNDAPAAPPADVALVVAGGPTHAFSMSRPQTRADAIRQGAPGHRSDERGLREWLAGLPDGRHGARLAAFDTRVAKVRHFPGSAAKRAARTARQHGYDVGITPQSFYVEDTPGPLLDGERQRAETWGLHLGELVGKVSGGSLSG